MLAEANALGSISPVEANTPASVVVGILNVLYAANPLDSGIDEGVDVGGKGAKELCRREK